MKSTILKFAVTTAGACTFAAMPLYAQSTSTASAGQSDLLEEITITGSRVITNGNDAPTPVTVITPEQILAVKPSTVYENLIDMPVFSGSRGAQNGPVSSNPQNSGAVSTLNLRNMGALRTLVLFDGHRMPATTPTGEVDASALPQMLLQRVDVVTGGASAVYGSDAVTGVVNFVTDTKFNGVKLNLQRGISDLNDDSTYQIGIAAGTELFGGRGHIEASYQRNSDEGLYDYQRDWTKPRWSVFGSTTVPYHLVAYAGAANASFGGTIACPNGNLIAAQCAAGTVPPLIGMTFHQNGVASPYDAGLMGAANGLPLSTVQIGGDAAYFVNVALKSSNHQDQFFTRFDYDLADDIHAYIAGSWSANYVFGNTGTQRTFTPGVNIGACNAFLPTQYQTALGCTTGNAGTATEPTFKFEKQFNSLDNYGIGQNNGITNHNYFVMASLDGKFGNGYRWDATYTHSQATLRVQALNQNRQHIYASLDATIDPSTGRAVCRVTLTNPTVNPGCIPINLFGPTAPSEEALLYWFDWIQNTTKNKMDGLSASVTGAPLNSWAGPIDMALSAELRKQTMDLDTNSKATDFLNCTGLRFGNCSSTTPVHPNTWLPISGVNQKILEAAYEMNMPLLKDRSFFKTVNFNGAVRATQYKNDPNDSSLVSRNFNATTWKLGLVWDVTDDLTVRWSRSKDIRAPSLYDLYLPVTIGNFTNGFDYLQSSAGIAISPRSKTGGNPYLNPEVGLTSTLGIVYRPAPNFSVSLDAYRISLSDALYSLNGSSEPIQKACYASGGTSPLCQLQERPYGFADTSAANAMTAFWTRFVNIAQQRTSGIDLEANFSTRFADQPLQLRALVTYQPHILYDIPALPRQDVAGVAYPQFNGGLLPAPVWRGTLYVHYNITDRWAVDISERYRSRLHWMSGKAQASDPDPVEIGSVAPTAYTNLSLSYQVPMFDKPVTVFANVQNLFNKDPPPAGSINPTFPGAYPGVYAVGDDIVGRYYTVGVRMRL